MSSAPTFTRSTPARADPGPPRAGTTCCSIAVERPPDRARPGGHLRKYGQPARPIESRGRSPNMKTVRAPEGEGRCGAYRSAPGGQAGGEQAGFPARRPEGEAGPLLQPHCTMPSERRQFRCPAKLAGEVSGGGGHGAGRTRRGHLERHARAAARSTTPNMSLPSTFTDEAHGQNDARFVLPDQNLTRIWAATPSEFIVTGDDGRIQSLPRKSDSNWCARWKSTARGGRRFR